MKAMRQTQQRRWFLMGGLCLLLTCAILVPGWAQSPSPANPLMQRYLQYGRLNGAGALLQAAMDGFQAREYYRVRMAFEALLELDEHSAEAAYYLGKIAYESGDLRTAREYFHKAHQALPVRPEPAESADGDPLKTVSADVEALPDQQSQKEAIRSRQTGWVSVTGKPMKKTEEMETGSPVLVKLLDPNLRLLSQDGWVVPPLSAQNPADAIYQLTSGDTYRLQRARTGTSSVPIYLGALAAVLVVFAISN